MPTLKDFFEIINYRITEGGKFMWSCYGPNTYVIDSDNEDHSTVSVIFDTETQQIYQLEAHDYDNRRAYRWSHPFYDDLRLAEAAQRNVNDSQAWDEVNFIELSEISDFTRKASAIARNEPYDTMVSIKLDLPDDIVFKLMLQAHEENITFNELVVRIIREYIDNHG